MSVLYEAFWHAIIVGPVLILIALFEFLTGLVQACSQQVDRCAGDIAVTSDPRRGDRWAANLAGDTGNLTEYPGASSSLVDAERNWELENVGGSLGAFGATRG